VELNPETEILKSNIPVGIEGTEQLTWEYPTK
jgi:hypothetical protein